MKTKPWESFIKAIELGESEITIKKLEGYL